MTNHNTRELPIEDLRWIHCQVDAFEGAWRAGQRPEIEDYLAESEEPRRTALLRDLLQIEWEIRRVLCGERPEPREYVARFPELAGWIEMAPGFPEPGWNPQSTITDPPARPADHAGLPHLRHYELLKEIGKGGMGVVYLGRRRDAIVDFQVAVKTILVTHFPSAEYVERFLDDVRTLVQLQHPNIVPILDCGESDDGQPYYVMSRAKGSLAQHLDEKGRMEPQLAAENVRTIAKAVQYLHEKGIVHRDLKPQNILIDDADRLWVADFGLAGMLAGEPRAFRARPGEGTIPYMSPEQAEGRELESLQAGCQSDLWSLGVILYELLIGQTPFQGQGRAEIRYKILHREPPVPRQIRREIPRDLQRIVMKCLEKSPADRYQCAAELIEDLDRSLRREPLKHATPGSLWERLERWARREPGLATRWGVAASCSAILWLHPILFGEIPHPSGGHWVERFPNLDVFELRVWNQLLFVLWMLGSWSFQRLDSRAGWADWARRAWLTTDILVLAGLIAINEALMTPLPVAFAVLIAASGLWFHVPTVVSTTAMAMAAYVVLISLDRNLNQDGSGAPHKYHFYYLIALPVLGAIVVYQVRRVQTLNRLYEQRPRL